MLSELPVSLSVTTTDGMTTRIFDKGTPLPCEVTRVFSTAKPAPTSVMIELVAGERLKAKANKRVARVRIGGVKTTVGRIIRVEARFAIDAEGVITVEAFDHGSHHKKKKVISPDWIPSEQEISDSEKLAAFFFEEECHEREKMKIYFRAKQLLYNFSALTKDERFVMGTEKVLDLKNLAKELKSRMPRKPQNMTPIEEKTINEYSNMMEKRFYE